MKRSIALVVLALSTACSHLRVPPELQSAPLPIEEKPGLAGPERTAAGLGSTILLLYKRQQPKR